jgi:methyl-accepting chemotaxis protein
VRQLSDELFAGQQRLRDEDIHFAKTLLIGIALVALVFGVLAAWLITRQIVRPLAETLASTERIAQGDLSLSHGSSAATRSANCSTACSA